MRVATALWQQILRTAPHPALGEKKAFADEDRDRLELNYTYTINYVVNEQTGETASYTVETNEVMCLRARENTLEEFSFVLK